MARKRRRDESSYSESESRPRRKRRVHHRKEKESRKKTKHHSSRRRRRRRDESPSYDSYDEDSRSPTPRPRKSRRGKGDEKAVEEFIKHNEINSEVASRLRRADPEVQELVVGQGKNVIDNSRNPNGVVIQRIRKHEVDLGIANSGPPRVTGGRPDRSPPRRDFGGGINSSFKEGDWTCPGCQGHNFSKREDCFKCGKPKESNQRSRSRSRSRSG